MSTRGRASAEEEPGIDRKSTSVLALFACVFSALPAVAEDWITLDTAGIRAALTDRIVDYENAWQRFDASGRTLYNAGTDSFGSWDTRGGQYCSQWPPNSDWFCYDVEVNNDGTQIRFVAPGDVSVGVFR